MEEYLNEHGCRLIVAESKEALARHETDQSIDNIRPMDVKSIHIVCDAVMRYLDEDKELDNREGITKICESVVRLMPDIKMVKSNQHYFGFFSNSIDLNGRYN